MALLLAQFRRLDLVEDALGDAVEAASRTWPADGVPDQPAGVADDRGASDGCSTGCAPRTVARRKLPLLLTDAEQRPGRSPHHGRRRQPGRGRRAAPGADVRPPGAGARGRQRAEPAAGPRRADGRHRPAVPRARADDGRADHARQEAHRRGRHPVRRARRRRAARTPRGRGADRLPHLHRRLLPRHRPRPAARRPVRGGDPARARGARPASGRAGARRAARADAAAALPARRPGR